MDPHFLLPNWKRTFLGIFCVPQRGNDPPIYLLLWPEAGAAATCGGLRLLAAHARSISLIWKMEKRSHFFLVLFLSFSFIHWLKMFVHDTPLSLYMDTYPLLWSQAQPCPWKLRPFGDQCQQFGDHCLCLKLWQFEIISVSMKAQQIRCHQSVPYPAPRIGQFQNRKQSLDNFDVVGNDDGCW